MYKKIVLTVLIITMLIVFHPISNVFSAEAASADNPVITAPLEYSELPYISMFTLRWKKPASGTVSQYIINVRELTVKGEISDNLVIENYTVNSNIGGVGFPWNYFNSRGYYRASVCAVMSDGTKRWSAERYFYYGISRGVKPQETLNFKIWTGFESLTKTAIHNSADAWNCLLSWKQIDTYPNNQGVSFSELRQGDGINAIGTCNTKNNTLMTAYTIRSSASYTQEVDIIINKYHPWGNGTAENYDIQNVMTHEMGHATGLIDKYESHATEWTMYGSSKVGEQKKRTLSTQDKNNVHQLYGE